jgi:hypothetical protein
MWFKRGGIEQEGILATASVIERTWCDLAHYTRAHASSACEVRIALAAIANLFALWDFRAVKCD